MKAVAAAFRRLGQALRLMVGLPDYDAYLRHRQRFHPDEPVPSRAEFVRRMQQRRFDGKPGSRCC